MANVPEGAQLSEDRHWWWDADAQKWQPVEGDGAPASGEADSSGAAGGDDRTAARVAQGLPASLTDITDEQRGQYIGEPTVEIEAVDQGEVEAVAMDDSGGQNGEATA